MHVIEAESKTTITVMPPATYLDEDGVHEAAGDENSYSYLSS
jgi:hypothetical protein